MAFPKTNSLVLGILESLKNDQNDESWNRFDKIYRPPIKIYVVNKWGQDTDDLIQEILLKLFRALPSFNYMSEQGRFSSYVIRICHNTASTFHRKGQRSGTKLEDTAGRDIVNSLKDADAQHEKVFAENDLAQYVCKHGERTYNSEHWEIFLRTEILDCEPKEVAAEFEIPLGTVYSIRSRIKAELVKDFQNLIDGK